MIYAMTQQGKLIWYKHNGYLDGKDMGRPGAWEGPRDVGSQRFLLRFEMLANAQLRQQLHGAPVDTSPTAAERFPDAQTIPAYLNNPNHYWSFFGPQPVNNFFVATGPRYWKPAINLQDGIRLPAGNTGVDIDTKNTR